MNEPIRITEAEAEQYLEFLVDMCERNRCIWRIDRPDGSAVMLCPVVQTAAPVPHEVMEQVEEFKKQFMEENASRDS